MIRRYTDDTGFHSQDKSQHNYSDQKPNNNPYHNYMAAKSSGKTSPYSNSVGKCQQNLFGARIGAVPSLANKESVSASKGTLGHQPKKMMAGLRL